MIEPGMFLPDRVRPRLNGGEGLSLWSGVALLVAVVLLAVVFLLPLSTRGYRCSGYCGHEVLEILSAFRDIPIVYASSWVTDVLSAVPNVAAVEARVDPLLILRVRVWRQPPVASYRGARLWHGISASGFPCGPLEAPVLPEVEGPLHFGARLRRELAVAGRFSSLGRVEKVKLLYPGRYMVLVEGARLLVMEEPTEGEKAFFASVAEFGKLPSFADLRFSDRIVIRGLD